MNKFIILPLRSILRQGRQSIISVIGLSVALTSCILILLYIRYETSYDRYHKNAGNIYRVLTQHAAGFSYMGKRLSVVTPAPLKDAMMTEIPGVERSCKCKLVTTTLEYNSTLFSERGFLYADPDFLQMFTFPVLSGNPSEALKEPFSLFVTRSMALKYFGNENPIGKTIKAGNQFLYTVKGVLEDVPPNSHFKFDFLTGFETLYRVRGSREEVEQWPNFSYLTYVQLPRGLKPENITNDIANVAEKHLPDIPMFKGTKWVLQPLEKIHLGGQNNFDPSGQSDVRYIFLVASIGIIIFLIACINYMNMATARCFSRGREIGIYKVSGSSRTKIIFRLISESVLISSGGLIVAMVLVFFILPAFAGFTDRPLSYRMIFMNSMPFMILTLSVLMGIFAGLIPALWLSSFNPLRLIKEEFTDLSGKRKSGFLKNILIGFQYTISIVALVSAFTISGQLSYIKSKDQGFISRNVITIELKDPDVRKNPFFLMNEIRTNPKIANVSASYYLPHSISSASFGFWEGKPDELQAKVFRNGIDTEFLDFYDLQLVSGRGFSKEFRDDSLNSYLINETAARLLGYDDPVGMKFGFQKKAMGIVVGIVKDFNYQSLRLPIEPLAISAIPTQEFPETQYISIKVNEGYIPEIQLYLEKLLKKNSPGYLNPVSVLSENIESMYTSDRRLSEIILFSTILALILTCLGQYSLSFYTAQKRTREMAIRKVFGATQVSVMSLFIAELIKLILVSGLIAGPISWLVMNKWLENYAFRIYLKPSIFFFSLAITLAISIAVISYHVFKLSKVNPAETIRYE